MKKALLTLITIIAVTTVSAQKYVGGDISLLTKYETNGAKYYDLDGNAITDMLDFFKQQGMNAMRVRLFVDPTKSGDIAACQDLPYIKALGKRIKEAGFSLMLDFHYSDTWADPKKQWTPDNWKNLSDDELATKLYNYTKECLTQMVAAGATPDFIQTGNEISYGMLWGTKEAVGSNNTNRCYTDSPAANWTRFFNLLKKTGQACREVCKKAKIILHSERAGKPNVLTDYFDRMKSNDIDYDIIGLSYYPYYHGDLATLETALNTLESKNYGKDIMIVEAGYYYAWQPAKKSDTNPDGIEFDYSGTYPITPIGQQAFTKALISMLNKHEQVKGLYWWWMEACENGLDWSTKRVSDKWYNASLFNDSNTSEVGYPAGKAMPAIAELKNFIGDPSGIETMSREPLTVNQHAWYTLDGRKLNGKPSTKGIYIQNGKKKIVR